MAMSPKIAPVLSAILLTALTTFSQPRIGNETSEQKQKRMEWWTDGRFGMFIHWGLYSEAARHEWVKHNEHMTNEQYQK
jgi:alpha-L-fucosidase